MTTAALPLGRQPSIVGRLVPLLLAAALLTTGFSGNASVQVLDGAMLAKLYRIHRHGVPGEAAYIATHGTWEGYVLPHCHRQISNFGQQPGPDEVQVAASLAGAAACTEALSPPLAPPSAWQALLEAAETPGPSLLLPPLTPPPR